jgi:hypothetical protein
MIPRSAAVVILIGMLIGCSEAIAGPPTYRILRRHAAPAKHHQPGHPEAVMVDARATGYAYGFFGVPPRSHASRHFGYYRTFTQWSVW